MGAGQVVFIYSWQQLLLKCISLCRTLEDAPQVKVKARARTLHMWFPIPRIFRFVFLRKLLLFKDGAGYKGFMLDGCTQVTLNGCHIFGFSVFFVPVAIKWPKCHIKVAFQFKALSFECRIKYLYFQLFTQFFLYIGHQNKLMKLQFDTQTKWD